MADPPVSSSSNNLPRGWICKVICSQNPELMLEFCAPESINAVTFCLSTITGASLDHPNRWATGSGFKKGMTGAASCRPVHQATFMLAGLHPELGWECEGPTVGWGNCCQQGVTHIPSGWLKAVAGVGHSLAMWPHPWHLKHWRVWVPPIGHALPPCTRPLSIASISSAPCPVGKLWAGVVCPGPLLPWWELGDWGATTIAFPPMALFPGATWSLEGLWPCPALIKAAMSLAICCPNSAIHLPGVSHYQGPSPHLIPDFLILTFCLGGGNHQLWVGGSGSAIQVPDGVTYVLQTQWKRKSLRCCWTSRSVILLGHCNLIWLRVPSNIVAKGGPSYCLIVTLGNFIRVLHQNIKRGHCVKSNQEFQKCGLHWW